MRWPGSSLETSIALPGGRVSFDGPHVLKHAARTGQARALSAAPSPCDAGESRVEDLKVRDAPDASGVSPPRAVHEPPERTEHQYDADKTQRRPPNDHSEHGKLSLSVPSKASHYNVLPGLGRKSNRIAALIERVPQVFKRGLRDE